MKIINIRAREIFDSRGLPTIECEIMLENGSVVTASVPSGLSKGSYEAIELHDGGARFFGKGVETAVEIIETIIGPELIGKEPEMVSVDLWMIEMDGTSNKSKLGANTMLAMSIAMCKAQALAHDLEIFELIANLCEFESVSLPVPLFNMINGGMHGSNGLVIQEFMLVPTGYRSYKLCLEAALESFFAMRAILDKKGKKIIIGDEGGYATAFRTDREALDLLMQATHSSFLQQEQGFLIALDVAATQFYDPEQDVYHWRKESLSRDELIEKYVELKSEYPLYAIEDGLHEDDWEGWKIMHSKIGESIHLVGDDIIATNPHRIVNALTTGCIDGAIIKPNQIGTITETLQAIKLCKEQAIQTIVSHRSGETEDTFIVDLAVGVSAHHVKIGGCTRGERVAKYNRLLRIEDSLMLSLLE